MNNIIHSFFLCIVIGSSLSAQQIDSTRSDISSAEEQFAGWTATGIVVPLAIAGVVISIVPPAFTSVISNGVVYGGMNFESGIGLGTFRETGVFSDWRLSLGYSYIVSSKVKDFMRLEVKRDFHFDFVDRRKIFLAGMNFSGGLMTDFPNKGYTFGAGLSFQTPWLSYFGFFPQHYFGAAYRYHKFFSAGEFHEVTLGVSSSFTF